MDLRMETPDFAAEIASINHDCPPISAAFGEHLGAQGLLERVEETQ
jgi:hypothetical protein